MSLAPISRKEGIGMPYGSIIRTQRADKATVCSPQVFPRSIAADYSTAWDKLPPTDRLAIVEHELKKAA
jgi:hypothetical protein